MANNRLPPPFGRSIDRQRTLAFRFAGRAYSGLAGDTVASALIANGIWAVAASPRRQRPRGIHALAEPGAESWVALPDLPHAAADTMPLRNGMALSPGGGGRRGTLPSLPAGGRRPETAEHVRTDVAIVGGGPAGIAAAIAAADAGRQVVLVERLPVLGGTLLYGRLDPEGRAAPLRRDALVAALAERPAVQVWTDATCFALGSDRLLQVAMGERRIVLRADGVVLATGSIGQRMVFRDNDLPGVIQARAAERLIHLYGVRPGARAVVAAADGAGLGAALTLLDAGVEVPAVLDILDDPSEEPLRRAISARGVPVFRGHTVVAGLPTEGGARLGAVVAAPAAGPDHVDSAALRIMCEVLCLSGGWHPSVGLAVQAGARLRYDAPTHRLAAEALPPGIFLAGAAAGVAEVAAAELDGLAAGEAAALGVRTAAPAASRPNLAWPLVDDPMRRGAGSDYLDRTGDVTRRDLAALVDEGIATPADLTGERRTDPADVATLHRLLAGGPGATVPDRVISSPVAPGAALTLGDLAEPLSVPSRRGPLDRLHRDAGARMAAFGSWLMPAAFPIADAAAVEAEVRSVREHIGLMDRSDLGKVVLSGEHAAALLDRVLAGQPGSTEVGGALLIRPAAAAVDPVGAVVAARLGDEDFLLTVQADRAASLVRRLREAVRPDERVAAVDITAAHAVLAVAGPNAPTLLASLGGSADILAGPASRLAVGATRIAGIGTLILRTGAVGEPTFELFVAAGLAAELWQRLAAAGRRHGLRPVGREAERLLRLETGHPDVPGDIADLVRLLPGRPLVGVGFSVGKAPYPTAGQPILSEDGAVVGKVLAAALSASLGHGVGMAVLAADRPDPGSRLLIAQPVGPAIVAVASSGVFRKRSARPARPPVAAPADEEAPAAARRSPVHDRLAALEARFVAYGGGLVADAVPLGGRSPDGPGLLDLSGLPRLGFVGAAAAGALLALGLPPQAPGTVARGGGLIAALPAPDEALVLPDPANAGDSIRRLVSLAPEDGCPGLLRGDMEAWFMLCGPGAANCLASLGCDRAALQEGRVGRWTLFGCETLLIPDVRGVHLLVEAPFADYLWDGICRILPRFGGGVLGLAEAVELR